MKYKQIIEFTGRAIDDVFKLPCVQAAEKCLIVTMGQLVQSIKLQVMTAGGRLVTAYAGNMICEDYNGLWHVKTQAQLKAEEKDRDRHGYWTGN